MAVEKDDPAVEGVPDKRIQARSRHVDPHETRRDVQTLTLGDEPDQWPVVVRVSKVGVPAAKRGDRVQQKSPGHEEARGALWETVEVGWSEAHGARIVEVLIPRKLRQQLPECSVRIAADFHLDVTGPYLVT